MKKTQFALAALALVASTAALADVTIYGALDASLVSATGKGTNFDGTGAWTAPSHLGFRGSDDLGGGMKAGFVYETGVSLNNGAATSGGSGGGTLDSRGFGALFTREAKVSLSGDFGSVTLGQQLSPYIITQVVGAGAGMLPGQWFVNRMILSGFGAAAVNMNQGSSGTSFAFDGFFIPNSINYTSPTIGGFTVSAMTQLKGGATDGVLSSQVNSDSYQAITISGAVGPVNTGFGYQTRSNTSSGMSIYGTMPLSSDLTVGANYTSEDATKSGGSKIGSSGVFTNYKLSDALSAQLAYARNDLNVAGSLTNLSMKYDLSKRTFLYGIYALGSGGADPTFANRGGFSFNNAGAKSITNFTVGVSTSF